MLNYRNKINNSHNRFEALAPLLVTKASGLFDVFIAVQGGGPSGQAGAVFANKFVNVNL